MSLESPTLIEKGLALLKTKPVYIGALCILGLLILWYTLTQVQSCRSNREIDKMRANVNAATQELKQAQANVAQDKVDEAVKLEQVKAATNAFVEAANATDAAKAETNRALTNLSNAVANGHPVNITADDLQKRLNELDNK